MATSSVPCPADPPPGTGNATYYEYHGAWCLNNAGYVDGIIHWVQVGLIVALAVAVVALAFHLGPRRRAAITGTLALAGLAVLHPVIFYIAGGIAVATGAAAWWVFRRYRRGAEL
jgi:hypothetical protein